MENVPPQTARGVWREVRDLLREPPPGVRLAAPHSDLADLRATIDGPADTPYEGGAFSVRVSLGRDFPAAPPRVSFLTKIFHPNVSAAGAVCVDTLARAWRPELGLAHVLLTLRCLLIAPNPDSALNADAGALLRDRYEDYFRRARLYTQIHAAPAPASDPAHAPELAPAPAPAKRRRRVLKRL